MRNQFNQSDEWVQRASPDLVIESSTSDGFLAVYKDKDGTWLDVGRFGLLYMPPDITLQLLKCPAWLHSPHSFSHRIRHVAGDNAHIQ
nr:hypothetical protein Itr_chr04CG12240 [Ipomoea trifida]